MCLYPRLIKNQKYVPNKKNGGVIPAVSDKRVLAVPIKCGECSECRKAKAREWTVRLMEEIRADKNVYWVALTFSDQSITKFYDDKEIVGLKGYDKDNKAASKAQYMMSERHRKKHKKALKHWLITELGHEGTENIHMHGFIWTTLAKDEITKLWSYGGVYFGEYVNETTINYTVKYVTKLDSKHKNYKSQIFASKGIGKTYTKTFNAKQNKYVSHGTTNETYTGRSGHKLSLPIYYRNKIYTDEQKEQLWLQKLDKNERWIKGKRINISKDTKIYYKLLKEAQQDDKRQGYNTPLKDWTQKKYEQERRIMLQNQRKIRGFEGIMTEEELKIEKELLQWEQIMNN